MLLGSEENSQGCAGTVLLPRRRTVSETRIRTPKVSFVFNNRRRIRIHDGTSQKTQTYFKLPIESEERIVELSEERSDEVRFFDRVTAVTRT